MVMVLHDPSDIILEVTKMLSYAEWEQTSTVMFVVFMASWFLTRLVYFPFWIVWSTRSDVGPFCCESFYVARILHHLQFCLTLCKEASQCACFCGGNSLARGMFPTERLVQNKRTLLV